MKKPYRINKFFRVPLGISIIILSLAFCFSPWGKALDNFVYDAFFLLRGSLEEPSDIVIVAIDEPSFAELKKQWPWPRSLHAELIATLFESGASVVSLDILFAEPSTVDNDNQLAKSLASHTSVVLAGGFNPVREKDHLEEVFVGPLQDLLGTHTEVGFVNLPVESDGFVRKLYLSQKNMEPFALRAAKVFCAKKSCQDSDVSLLPSGKNQVVGINFLGPPRTIRIVSYYQALSPVTHFPRDFFKDKLVFVGLFSGSAIEGKSKGTDAYPMPFSRLDKGYMAGVEIHAHAADNFIRSRYIRFFGHDLILPVCIIAGIFAFIVFFHVRPGLGIVFYLFVVISGTATEFWLLFYRSHYFPFTAFIVPVSAIYLTSPFVHYLQTRREKTFVRKAFTSYLAPKVVDEILKNPLDLRLGEGQ